MTGAEQGGDREARRHGEDGDEDGPGESGAQAGANAGRPDGNVGADDEHHEGESDVVAEEAERRIRRGQDVETAGTEDDADDEFADDDGEVDEPGDRQERPENGDGANERQLRDGHVAGRSASRMGMSVFSSVW